MIFANAKSITTPKGNVVKIENSIGILWLKNTTPPLKGNLVPKSIDTDGSIYKGVGYADGYRMNSSGNQVAYTGVAITGHIECEGISDADLIYIDGVEIVSDVYCGITFYDASFNVIYTLRLLSGSVQAYDVNTEILTTSGTTISTDANGVTTLKINFHEANYALAPPKYFRVFAKGKGADMDIRLNETI